MIFIASNGRLGAGSHLRNSLQRKPSRFVSGLERLPWSSQTPTSPRSTVFCVIWDCISSSSSSQRGPKLYKLPSPEVSQVFLRLSTQPVAIWRKFSSRASTSFSLTTWKLGVWLRQLVFKAYRKNTRKILMRHTTVVLGLTLNVCRCSLARVTGPFSSQESFCLVQRERQPVYEAESLKKHVPSTFLRHHFTQDPTRIRRRPSTLRT